MLGESLQVEAYGRHYLKLRTERMKVAETQDLDWRRCGMRNKREHADSDS